MVSDSIYIYVVAWMITYFAFYNQEDFERKQIGVWMLSALCFGIWFWETELNSLVIYIMSFLGFWFIYDHYINKTTNEGDKFMKDELF